MAAKRTTPREPVARELEMIKKLLIMQLLIEDVPQRSIAKALGIDPAALSRMIPARLAKRAKKPA